MELTVAQSQNSEEYDKALAWLDTKISRLRDIVGFAVLGAVSIGLWLYLISHQSDDSLVYVRHLRTVADYVIWAATFWSKWFGLMCLTASIVGLLAFPFTRHARRTGKIVRLHPTVLMMLEYQLGNYGLDDRKRAAIRWLANNKASQLAKANNNWVNDKQQHGENAEELSRVDLDLCDALGLLVSSCKASNEIR
jgi:hypothetical protein